MVNVDGLPRLSAVGADSMLIMYPAFPTVGAFLRNSDASNQRPKANVGYKKRRPATLNRDRQYNNYRKKESVTKERRTRGKLV